MALRDWSDRQVAKRQQEKADKNRATAIENLVNSPHRDRREEGLKLLAEWQAEKESKPAPAAAKPAHEPLPAGWRRQNAEWSQASHRGASGPLKNRSDQELVKQRNDASGHADKKRYQAELDRRRMERENERRAQAKPRDPVVQRTQRYQRAELWAENDPVTPAEKAKYAPKSSAGQCGADKSKGGKCSQPKMVGKDRCQYHGGK